jgi:hypothetical protein
MSGVRWSLNQQIDAVGEEVSAKQMLVDSGRAKLAGGDARGQMERLKAARATLLALLPIADILRAVLRLDAARLATLREMLTRWGEEQDAERVAGEEGGDHDGV